MREIFGIPMSTILIVLVGLFAICLFTVALVAWRQPVLFKLGVRNIPRRRAQSTLIVVGLMLSTLIISAALGVGDTLNHSTTSDVYRQLGHIDALVLHSQDFEANRLTALMDTVDESALGLTESALKDNDGVDGLMPFLDARVPAMNHASGQSEPSVTLSGIDPGRLDQFGGLQSTDGDMIDLAAMPQGHVVISAESAEVLDAKPGDTITVFYANTATELVVWDITPNTTLAGYRESAATMVMPLDRLQALTDQPGTLTGIAISTTGGTRNTGTDTEAILEVLRPAFAGQDLGIDPAKIDAVSMSQDLASMFTSLFLVLGLFSVSAGVLLIVLIFTMLAAERRSEMGMARAVGTHRRQLVQKFISEGAVYAFIAGMVGSALGVAATWGIAKGMSALLGEMLTIEPNVTSRSLVVAYTLGMVITFMTVVASSWKVSRLNIVAAVRDIPDVVVATRKKSGLVWGIVFLLLGGLLTIQGLGGDAAFPFYTGMSLLPLGLARITRFFGAPSRPVYSLVGIALLMLWMLPMDVAEDIFGTLDGDMEMFFLSGIFMVIGATMLVIQNTDLLMKLVSLAGGLLRGTLPAVRTAVAYPGAAPGRTGMTIAMFSLIIFSLVMMSTMNSNYMNMMLGDEANAGWHVRADLYSANPVDDFATTLEVKDVTTDGFTAVGTVTTASPFGSEARVAGTGHWKTTTVHGMDEPFIAASEVTFQQRAEGYATDAEIIEALRTEPNVAIVDSWMVDLAGDTTGNGDTGLVLTGLTPDMQTFTPMEVELLKSDGTSATVTIIGVINDEISTLSGLYASQPTVDAVYGTMAVTSYYVALANPDAATDVAQEIEDALMQNGAQGISIQDELEESQAQQAGFLYLVQGFMGLGLFVGIAAVGVIAFRSVVERRQQIGVLRALGFQRGLVSLSFLIETAFIVGMGVLSGVVLGLVLSRNMFTSDVDNATFTVPWEMITGISLATVVIALLMTWMPSRQAARIAPAEALRYE